MSLTEAEPLYRRLLAIAERTLWRVQQPTWIAKNLACGAAVRQSAQEGHEAVAALTRALSKHFSVAPRARFSGVTKVRAQDMALATGVADVTAQRRWPTSMAMRDRHAA